MDTIRDLIREVDYLHLQVWKAGERERLFNRTPDNREEYEACLKKAEVDLLKAL